MPYNMRQDKILKQPRFTTVRYCHNSVRYFGCKLWNSLPNAINSIDDFNGFNSFNSLENAENFSEDWVTGNVAI